jgi:hypothetical protein
LPEYFDPDARVTRLVSDTPTRDNGSIDPTGFRRDVTYAHLDHELWYTARGYRATERGVLHDLTA